MPENPDIFDSRDSPVRSEGRGKIVRVITRLNIGGPAQHVTFLTAFLDEYGWASTLVAGQIDPHEGDMADVAYAHGVTPVALPTLRNGAGPLADLASFIWLYRFFRQRRPTIVHVHLFKARLLGGLAARLAGIPLVVETIHGTVFSPYYSPRVSRFLVWLERGLGRMMDAVVAVSEKVAEEIIDLQIARPDRVHIIPLGLELGRFLESAGHRGALRSELGLPDDTPLVGAVARLVPIKGFSYFVDAAARVVQVIPRATFVVAGDGPERQTLERRVQDRGLGEQIRFLGWRRDLERIYPDLDVVMLASLNEGTPVALIEAMAAGRPVVATHVGGVPDIVQDGMTGVLVPPKDAQALADAVVRLLRDPDERRRMGDAGRRAVYPRFTAERLARDMDALYRSLLERRRLTEGRAG